MAYVTEEQHFPDRDAFVQMTAGILGLTGDGIELLHRLLVSNIIILCIQ